MYSSDSFPIKLGNSLVGSYPVPGPHLTLKIEGAAITVKRLSQSIPEETYVAFVNYLASALQALGSDVIFMSEGNPLHQMFAEHGQAVHWHITVIDRVSIDGLFWNKLCEQLEQMEVVSGGVTYAQALFATPQQYRQIGQVLLKDAAAIELSPDRIRQQRMKFDYYMHEWNFAPRALLSPANALNVLEDNTKLCDQEPLPPVWRSACATWKSSTEFQFYVLWNLSRALPIIAIGLMLLNTVGCKRKAPAPRRQPASRPDAAAEGSRKPKQVSRASHTSNLYVSARRRHKRKHAKNPNAYKGSAPRISSSKNG